MSDCDWGIFFYSRDPRFMSLIDSRNSQKWQILISVNHDLDFFLFSEIRDQKPPPLLLKFSYMEKVFKIDLNLQTFFSSIFICIF